MSLFYLTVKNLNKSTQSAVASASYKSGDSLYSERDMETKSYKTREVKPETHILAPSHAPEWVNDRERLWNEVEKVEIRGNSRLAKEIIVALPVELSDEKQSELLLEYAKENFVDKGMVADVSIHRDVEHNPHAHIMLTTRPFNKDGSWGNKKKKEYIKDENGNFILDDKGKKTYKTIRLVDWDTKASLMTWRKNFSEKVNLYYQMEGINESVSHESYEKQGLNKTPKQRLTLNEYRLENREKEKAKLNNSEYKPKTYYGKINQEIEQDNKRLELLDKKIVELEKYKETVQDKRIEKIGDIRSSKYLSVEDRQALKVVASRVKGYVDYSNAKYNLDRLEHWKKKIDYQKRLLDAKANVLTKAKVLFEKEPKKVMLYGFIPNSFKEQFEEKTNEYKQEYKKYNDVIDVYNDLYSKSQRAFDIQKDFVKEEFAFLYPKYEEIINKSDIPKDTAMRIKSQHVKRFKTDGYKRDVIPELEGDLSHFNKNAIRFKLADVLEDWKNINKELVIAERTKEKTKNDYVETYKNNFDTNDVFEKAMKYTDSKSQVEIKEIAKSKIAEQLNIEMNKRYDNMSEIINEIPPKIQSKILGLHVEGKHTGILSEDLKVVREQEKYSNKSEFENNEHGTNSAQGTGDILGSLISLATQNENTSDDLERQRQYKKKKNNKLYRDLGELEL